MSLEMQQRADCAICGAQLAYSVDKKTMACAICGASEASHACCTAGHYVCDACHAFGPSELVFSACLRAETTDPLALAVQLMKSPTVHMHGPEHHFLVPAVLIAAYTTARGMATDERERMLREARKRAEVVKGGFCGLWGACGAGIGTGIFVSVVTRATPLSGREWRLANAATSTALARIAEAGGPRCCKRCSFLAITEAVAFAKRELGVSLDGASDDLTCSFHAHNRECTREGCRFYH